MTNTAFAVDKNGQVVAGIPMVTDAQKALSPIGAPVVLANGSLAGPDGTSVGTSLSATQQAGGATAVVGAVSPTVGVASDGNRFALNRIAAGINGFAHLSNRCRIADGTSTGAVKTSSRVRLTLPFGGSDIRLVYTNTITNSAGGEVDATATITVSASLEQSEGNPPLQASFNGQLSISIPAGQTVFSDPLPPDFANASVVWVTSCVSGASWPLNLTSVANAGNGGKDGDMLGQKVTAVSGSGVSPITITTSGVHGLTTGDLVTVVAVGGNTAANQTAVACTVTTTTAFTITGTGNANYTSGGYVLGTDTTALGGNNMLTSGGVNVFAPIAVVGIPPQGAQIPWAALFGDSITNGSGDNALSNAGWVVRALGGPTGCTIPFTNLSRSGTKASDFADVANMATKSQRRRRIGMGAPYPFNGYGRNDWANASTLAALQANMLAIATSSYRRGGRNITATLFPGTGGQAISAMSGDGTTVTATVPAAMITALGLTVGQTFAGTVAGVTPSGYNASAVMTVASATTVTYLNATSATVTVAGTLLDLSFEPSAQATIAGETVRTGFNDWLRDAAPIDATTLAAVAVGTTTNVLRVGSVGHPIWMIVDPTLYTEVNAAGVLTTNGGRWKTSRNAITANIASSNQLTVTANTGPALYVGATVVGQGIPPLTTITALGTGTGGAGTYTMSQAATATTVGISVTIPPSTDGTHPASWIAILASAALDPTKLVAYA